MEEYLDHKIGQKNIGYTPREDIEMDIAMDTDLNKIYNLGYLDALLDIRKKMNKINLNK
tara:strand:- start:212 stop:388 length:177 start_codon:yes stop_codon:yes gene_type:complete